MNLRVAWKKSAGWGLGLKLIVVMMMVVSCNDGKSNVATSKVAPTVAPTAKLTVTPTAQYTLQFEAAFNGKEFAEPVGLSHAGDGSGRLFVVEKPGIISVLSDDTNNAKRKVFLDISDKVNSDDSEQGLLGLAFHPDYKKNGYFYVNYTTPKTTVIARYHTDPKSPDKADGGSDLVLLEFNQPYANHNGGQLDFGPDGYLYIGAGDGGSAGDPQGNGQNLKTLLGKILRIDVNKTSGGRHYAIPKDNPFIGNKKMIKEEIYAYGLRNPWRFSFDLPTGRLWAADVGQNRVEEIDLIVKGKNYGWSIMEGSSCYKPQKNCSKSGITLPIWEYNPQDGGASVTGGYVYRGKLIPALQGKYLFADFIDGRVWSLDYDGKKKPKAELLKLRQANITSFGVDEAGEIYACLYDGHIVRLTAKRSG